MNLNPPWSAVYANDMCSTFPETGQSIRNFELRFEGRDQKQTIYVVSSSHSQKTRNSWSVYGRLSNYCNRFVSHGEKQPYINTVDATLLLRCIRKTQTSGCLQAYPAYFGHYKQFQAKISSVRWFEQVLLNSERLILAYSPYSTYPCLKQH